MNTDHRTALAASLALSVCLMAPPGFAFPAEPNRSSTLRVVGEGRAAASPDVAVAFLGAESTAPDLTAAARDANERMRRVIEALAAAGVAKKDIQTSRYDVGIERKPEPNGGPGPVSGYRVFNEVRVTVRDLAKVGPALDTAVKAGANAVHSLSFQKEDPSAERNRALASAIATARSKAEVMARAAGRQLGQVLEIGEGSLPRPLAMDGVRMMAAAAEAVPVEMGELQFTAQVEVVFALK